MKLFIVKTYKIIDGFAKRLNEDRVSVYAAQSAFFMVVSAFPLAMLIFSLVRYTSLSQEFLLEAASKFLPPSVEPMMETLINEMYNSASGTIISVTAITTVWSASKGVMAIISGLNNIYRQEERRPYFLLRLISSGYTLLFAAGLVLSLVMVVFGNSLIEMSAKYVPILHDVVEWIIGTRALYVPVILAVLFVAAYKLAGNKEYSFMGHLPGAVFSAVGWTGFSFFYSLYIDNFAKNSYVYGSLTTIVLMMLWIYVCMYILFIGAEINIYFRKTMIFLRDRAKYRLEQRKIKK